MTAAGDITRLLADFERGDSDATEKLAGLVYGHLRQTAAAYLARERPGHSLQPTLLVNDVFLRLMEGKRPSVRNRAREMFTGRHPFAAVSRKGTAHHKPLGRRLPIKIPITLAPVVRQCLELEPQKRFQSMQEVNAALQETRKRDVTTPDELLSRQGQPLRSVEFRKVRTAIGRMNYASFAESRRASKELRKLLETGAPEALRSAVIAAMRDLILSVPRSRSGTVSPAIREVRKLALELLRLASGNDLQLCLRPSDFEYLDLWNMNFSRLNLSGFRFERCFLVESSFEGCDLSQANFTGAWIRNVNFAGADLSDGDLTGADWFNALGLTENQLRSVRPETLMQCPTNEAQLRDYLDNAYGFPIGSWSDPVREQIFAVWKEYLQPGGLSDFVNKVLSARRESSIRPTP